MLMQQVAHILQHNTDCLHLHNLLHMAADIRTLLLHVFLTLLVSWLLSKALSNPKTSVFDSNVHTVEFMNLDLPGDCDKPFFLDSCSRTLHESIRSRTWC